MISLTTGSWWQCSGTGTTQWSEPDPQYRYWLKFRLEVRRSNFFKTHLFYLPTWWWRRAPWWRWCRQSWRRRWRRWYRRRPAPAPGCWPAGTLRHMRPPAPSWPQPHKVSGVKPEPVKKPRLRAVAVVAKLRQFLPIILVKFNNFYTTEKENR